MRRMLGLVVTVGCLLTGCTVPTANSASLSPRSTTTSTAAPSARTTTEAASPTPTPTGAASTVPVAQSHPTSHGCSPTPDRIPAHALQAAIVDVDGDGRPDTEWARLLAGGTEQFGIRTASGATVAAEQPFAGGADRSFVAGRLATGQTVLLVSESRDTDLYTFTRCQIRRTTGVYAPRISRTNEPFFFYSVYSGGAAGCRDGQLDGFEVRPDGEHHATVTARQVTISSTGRHATAGPPKTVVRRFPNTTSSDSAELDEYYRINCPPAKTLVPNRGHRLTRAQTSRQTFRPLYTATPSGRRSSSSDEAEVHPLGGQAEDAQLGPTRDRQNADAKWGRPVVRFLLGAADSCEEVPASVSGGSR